MCMINFNIVMGRDCLYLLSTWLWRRRPLPVVFLYTHDVTWLPIFPSSIPMKDSLLLSATSIAKLIEGCALFSIARKVVAVGMSCMHHG